MIYKKNPRGQIDQGDILYPIILNEWLPWWIDNNEHPIIILTPTCDVAQDKVDYHRFTVLQPLPFFFLNICHEIFGNDPIDLPNISGTRKSKITNKLDRAIKNTWPRYHFLPKENGVFKTNRIIDFEIVISVPLDTFSNDLRIARLESPFKEELIHRYSHYTMRIGTEDLSASKVQQIKNECFNIQI